MRQAGVIPDPKRAQQFADYLLIKAISTRLDETKEGVIVWVHDERFIEQSRQDLQDFLAAPDSTQFQDVAKEADRVRQEERKRESEYRKNVIDVRKRWQPRTAGKFPVTIALIVLSAVVSLAADFGKNAKASEWLYIADLEILDIGADGRISYRPRSIGLSAIYEKGQVWRLVSPVFLHVGGWIHLLMNMYWTYQFGALIETRRGSWRLVGIVLATAVLPNLAQYWWDSPFFGGMSGVGFGLFGYIWMKSRFDPGAGIYIQPNLVGWFLIWMLLCMTGLVGSIANAAHVAGLLVGMAIGYYPQLLRDIRGRA
ncbi:MAG TPA: rhomboid family intramembrane serine protease [Pirellulales bacterium]|nr:rhomboid family intramembrane serine protease [Pirellulales bacterium]